MDASQAHSDRGRAAWPQSGHGSWSALAGRPAPLLVFRLTAANSKDVAPEGEMAGAEWLKVP